MIATQETQISPHYVDLFKSTDMDETITLTDYLKSGDTIYVNNASSFCDPNVWKLSQEWNILMDASAKINEAK